jgi:hypothetical protein
MKRRLRHPHAAHLLNAAEVLRYYRARIAPGLRGTFAKWYLSLPLHILTSLARKIEEAAALAPNRRSE